MKSDFQNMTDSELAKRCAEGRSVMKKDSDGIIRPKLRPSTPESSKERFMKKVRLPDTGDGCWIWTAYCVKINEKDARGQFFMGNKLLLAYRASWMIFRGEIPHGMHVCHRCDNGICVNPDHLFLGTQKDNMRDMVAKGRHAFAAHPETIRRGSDVNTSKLNEEKVRLMRIIYGRGNISQAKLAKQFGITQNAAFQIIHRRAWAHVE